MLYVQVEVSCPPDVASAELKTCLRDWRLRLSSGATVVARVVALGSGSPRLGAVAVGPSEHLRIKLRVWLLAAFRAGRDAHDVLRHPLADDFGILLAGRHGGE